MEKIERWWRNVPDWAKWAGAAVLIAPILVAFPAAAALIIQVAARLGLATSAVA